MRSYVLDREISGLKKELVSRATDLARVVSEIREKLDVRQKISENPEEDRYRLIQSVTSFLMHASAVKPILVVIEDLYDVDKGILVQKLDSSGRTLWPSNGIVAFNGDTTNYSLSFDRQGGAIVTWGMGTSGASYIQRVSWEGKLLWNSKGIRLSP
jgi:hypothetical protein